jgi:MFS family permease
MRPGVLFFFIFIWLVGNGGRFTAPFLEDVAKFNESLIGLTFGLQVLFGSIFESYGSMKADEWELKYPKKGRLMFLIALLSIGTIGFELHFLIYQISRVRNDDLAENQHMNIAIISHIIARIIFSICSTLVFPILDGISLAYLKEIDADEGDYGKERLFGAVGWAIASLMIGPLIDNFGFLHVFFWSSQFSCIISVLVIVYYMKNQHSIRPSLKSKNSDIYDIDSTSPPSQIEMSEIGEDINVKNNIEESAIICNDEAPRNDLTYGDNMMILRSMFHGYPRKGFMISTMTLCMGTSVVENLVFLFFQNELGGSNTICGVSILVTVIFEVPIFQFSAKLLSKYGQEMLQKVACLAYVVRVVGYTLIPKEYVVLVLLFEPLHGVTYACAKTASVDFASTSSPTGFESTGQGIMSTFQGIGIIIGLSLGGLIEDRFSAAVLYRSYALVVGLGLVIFHMSTLKQSRHQQVSRYSSVSREPIESIIT